MEKRLKELEKQMTEPGFWDDQDRAKKVTQERQELKEHLDEIKELDELKDEVSVMIELSEEDETDGTNMKEIKQALFQFEEQLSEIRLKNMLKDRYDENNAIISLHAGAGGTESQDWVEMLHRMYIRWMEHRGFNYETLDFLPGDEAGVKSVTMMVKGKYAFGYLKSEAGVHRLVRVSPFDSSGRRHTSFASMDVVPEIDDDIEIDIKDDDLKIDTYRASGAGGQHVNTTDSAVRITHHPTGIVVQCQNERSQHKNREVAMKILKAKLAAIEEEKRRQEQEAMRGDKKEIAWGSQIRSYVFHPYTMVKDHRTNLEEGNADAVLDGKLDHFIQEYLKQRMNDRMSQ
ncbi:peptide chain release factor 2 (bRF-2) [Natranaerobius thermophilus JW/NM-WN-LF]|uniref:Peptide chain release factor 2 n=2 Tax=Natranaerobius TaxID=375928 RepID=B2A810_NATTJ|nr:peptide chain release factor 2 (bRF-2) [Natranaerobius thermophilus JW/NM-WN-LF]